jgi:peptide/nickel transport system substrate-binding protein
MKHVKLTVFILIGIILMVVPLLGACGGEATITATATATATTTTKPAEPEGTFTFGVETLSQEGFLPWITFQTDLLVFGEVYDTLAIQTPEGKHLPSLAESWEWSDNYTTLTLHIRQGVQFNNGWGELTAEDVAYTMNMSMSENSTSLARNYMEQIVESIEATGPYTVVVHQTAPNTDYADMYAFGSIAGAIVCKDYVEQVGEEEANIHPVGSGPYTLIQHELGDYIKYEAVDDHWRVVPEFKYLVIKSVPEESTRVAMLNRGEIDATTIGPNSIAALSSEDVTIDYWRYGPNSCIVFGGLCRPENSYYEEGYHNVDPWVDIRVREAMNIAINRDAINEALHYGTATPMTLVNQIPGWEDLPPIPYDPERARELLAEAAADGVFTPNSDGGFHFTLVSAPFHPGTPMVAKEAEAVVGYWADIGITVDINPLDFPAYYSSVEAIRNVGECFTFRLTYAGANPYSYLQMLLVDDNVWGTRWQCPEIETLWPMGKAALAELDLEKRDAMYREIAQVEYDSWIGIPLMQVPYIIAKSKDIGDWPPNSGSYYYNFEYIRHAQPLNTFRLFEIDVD